MVEQPIVTYVIIAATALTSIPAMNNFTMKRKLLFHPYAIKRYGEWYRFISSGFVHADWGHLLVNMFVLFSFGAVVEYEFSGIFGQALGPIMYLLLYMLAIPVAETYSFFKHKDNISYMSLGASGAVSAVLYASILMHPFSGIRFIFLPFFDIPAIVFGILYLAYSHYMSKKNIDNIGHDAHFYGAVFGFLFPICLRPQLFINFIEQVKAFF